MIWCVEDDASIRDIEVYALNSTGLAAEGFADGAAFWQALQKTQPELVVLDVMLPEIDGIELLRRMKADAALREIPVIMATAKGAEYDKIQGLDLGADDYLAKPFETKELLARIRAITRRNSEAVSTEMKYGDCTLNCLNYELCSSGGSVKLQNKEYQIMELLMANQYAIISAELMMEKIWGYDTDTEISVVWVNISYLRKKLSQIGSGVSIKAVRNQGYTLEYKEEDRTR